MIPQMDHYKFTLEESYRRRIRALLRNKDTISLAHLGKDRLLPRFVLLSPGWREHVNSTARTSPRPARLEDLRLALVYLNALVLDNLVIPNPGVDLERKARFDKRRRLAGPTAPILTPLANRRDHRRGLDRKDTNSPCAMMRTIGWIAFFGTPNGSGRRLRLGARQGSGKA